MESEWIMNFLALLFEMILSTKFIAQISAVNMEASLGRDCFIVLLFRTAPYPIPLLSLEPSV